MGVEVIIMTNEGAQPDAGPRWGRGHYSEDGGSWWNETSRRWFPLTGAQDTLEIPFAYGPRGHRPPSG